MSPALLLNNGHIHSNEHRPDGFATNAIHVGSEPSQETGAVMPSIALSTTFKQDAVGVHKGYEYSRSGNPNRDAFEKAVASLESGKYGIAFASGSATTATVVQSLGPGAHVVAVNDVYGGTFRYLTRVASETQGLEVSFVDLETSSDEAILSSIRPNTKLVWIESPTNPTLRVIDVPDIIRLVHSHPSHPLVLVDNTFLSPFYSSPLLLGADIVMHSVTKYINGHSDVVMGVLVLPQRHVRLAERLRYLQNASGAIPSPFDCWLALRGVKTLPLRMKQHGLNALRIANRLLDSPYVEEVIYPGLIDASRHAIALASLSPHAAKFIDTLPADVVAHGVPYGGMVSFRIKGGEGAAEKFLTKTRLFTLAESLGGVESLAELPALMTHGSIPKEEREKIGITDDLIRLSIGCEEVEDLIDDIDQALAAAVAQSTSLVDDLTVKKAHAAAIVHHINGVHPLHA
ncbi:hypothetical protein DACRYDRAFT_23792 [Dacryopinax primogenitus]|uniref:cystathionine gamma-lyase n=1 Tax=Dacryopinax primogenitus (strain DJM 731) TaxID=1858805 RepID=M5FUM3_DACPD|nr:uncharacterized protein DACRYDRAFT_23792 [Dacryopinax primogenitus]EJT99174.1 hypothetical protein DACRYDRAFT_23792 [Dacryopinax primogenitus]